MKLEKILLIAFIIMLQLSINSKGSIKANDFTYEMIIFNSNPIICEPMHVLTIAKYVGENTIEAYHMHQAEVIVNNEKLVSDVCTAGPAGIDPDTSHLSKYKIKNGDVIKFAINLRCFSPFWKPGKYNVRIQKRLNEETILEYPELSIVVSEPTGIDRDLFELSQDRKLMKNNTCKEDRSGNCRNTIKSPCTVSSNADKCFDNVSWEEMIAQYPTSRYAAWIWEDNIYDPILDNPKSLVNSIKNKNYLVGRSVWDGKWISLNGMKYAEWTKNKSLEIIRDCPSFPAKERFMLTAAISNIVLGDELQGVELLKGLIRRSNSREAIWAKEFLEEWMNQKTKF
ncbi:MAG: hypothetical protein A2Y62_19680 [Candidatus Fischerbacteria bacterium RBG_13_37_8]|uniref:Uncharacterized protein n=1 Tax=Candidatus Fischerbacteria bacterium RBG_13_37_8 TaxID=1817863 RepID=A0A1F5VXE8_9BACT|nr:MAG: hypothetical protein A2Y62_19680 [Candidatus Fischerbacteria bacterium RBG_13_37_8]